MSDDTDWRGRAAWRFSRPDEAETARTRLADTIAAEKRVANLESHISEQGIMLAERAHRIAELETEVVREIERSVMERRRAARLVLEEREACARVAEQFDAPVLCDSIADAIRARGSE